MINGERELFDYFQTNNLLIKHGYDLGYTDLQAPFEREMMIQLLIKDLKKRSEGKE